MKNENYKLQKAELTNSIIDVVQKTLKLDVEDNSMKKLKKAIKKAANTIAKKYLKKIAKTSYIKTKSAKSVKSIKPMKKASKRIKENEVYL